MMFDDCHKYMPSDLVTMKQETGLFDQDETKSRFKDESIHLMPLKQNAFYTRDDVVDSKVSSARYNNDFYKHAEIRKVESKPVKEEVK